MSTYDFFRARLTQDLRHPLPVLAWRPPWAAIEAALASKLVNQDRAPKTEVVDGLFGVEVVEFGGGINRAGWPRLLIRLRAGLLNPKNTFDLSDEELVKRWSDNVQFRHFCRMTSFERRLSCDAAHIGRFRRAARRRDANTRFGRAFG